MKLIMMYALPLLIIGAMIFGSYYTARRLAWAFGFSPTITLIVVIAILLVSMVSMMGIMRGNYTSLFSHILSNTSNIILGVAMFLICILFVVDLVHLFAKFQPLTFGLITVGLTLVITLFSLWNAQYTRVVKQEITLNNLQENLRIAQLTDIHLGHYWDKNKVKKLVDIIKTQDVDLVVITGDMFDGRIRLNSDVVAPFKELDMPIYFIEGNHDGYSGSRDIKNLLIKNDIVVLSNELVEYKGLQIVGLDYLLPDIESVDQFHAPPSNLTIKEVLPSLGIDKNRASIMLHHNPVGANYASKNGINLYLAGHTHAGQLFPATLVASMMFKYNKGLYKYDDTLQIYVSQGTGTFGPPMRLGTKSELTIIDLKSL
ncbi:MAG: metallophosphoesterase [bacterium]